MYVDSLVLTSTCYIVTNTKGCLCGWDRMALSAELGTRLKSGCEVDNIDEKVKKSKLGNAIV